MHLLLLPLLPLLLVPLFVICAAIFMVGAVLRLLFVVTLVFAAGFLLFGCGLLRGCFRLWTSRRRRQSSLRPYRPFDDGQSRDLNSSAFEDYRRATLRKLEDEAREFRAFLAKLKNAADAADFQDFLSSRRAGGPRNS